MNVVALLREELAPAGLRLRKAQPRGPGRLTMELDGPDGRLCAGQWHVDATESRRVAARLRTRFTEDCVQVLAGGHLVVQHAGADRRLPALHGLVTQPGAQLVAHRSERRAVVRLDADRYVKAVRPGRTADVVVPLTAVRPADLRVPRVLAADDRRGLVTVSAVPGRTLRERLGEPATSDEELATDAKQVGAALRTLHAHDARTPRMIHDGAAEAAAAQRWLEAASRYGLLDPDDWRRPLDEAGSLLLGSPPELALLHRDLHDKQVLLEPGEPVGLLDLDLAAYGDPALDLANLLVHLDLRARQGSCTELRAQTCSAALVEGYSPGHDLVGRLAAYAAATRLRLAGVYSFRDSRPGLVHDLLHHTDKEVPSWL